MKIKPYKLVLFLAFFGSVFANAQHFEKEFSKEISKGNGTISLHANYADIQIVEWKKNKIKIEAVMTVDGVSKEKAQNHFDNWDISLDNNSGDVSIVSKSNNYFSKSGNYSYHYDFDDFDFEMPEISFESLGVLDSMNFSFPDINFAEVLNDSVFKSISNINFNFFESDSTHFKMDKDKVKKNQERMRAWQIANQENLKKLQIKARKLAMANQEIHEKRMKKVMEKRMEMNKKRAELLAKVNKRRMEKLMEKTKKRNEIQEKRNELRKKINQKRQERRSEIKEILKNRNEGKVRTKLIIHVPKGTNFEMNVNYSKISTN